MAHGLVGEHMKLVVSILPMIVSFKKKLAAMSHGALAALNNTSKELNQQVLLRWRW